MTVARWRSMSEREQAEFLNSEDITVESKLVFDEPRVVGDVTAVSERYRAKVGPVILSGWKDNSADARMVAAGRIKTISKKAGYAKAN